MGGGQREEGRSPLSFNAWIAIAVGLLVVIVLGLHVRVYLRYRHERKVTAEAWRLGGSPQVIRLATWPMSVLADRWEPYGRLFDRLAGVHLGDTATDADLAHLSGLTELRALYLYDTQVTDAGLVHLAGLTKLRGLSLSDTRATDAGVAELRRKLPDLYVDH